jgi:hypothetical protein
MRIVIETPNGMIYKSADTPGFMLKETLVTGDEEEPKEYTDPPGAAAVICRWMEDLTNALSPFTITGPRGEVHIIPPEILKRSVITIAPSDAEPLKKTLIDFDKMGVGTAAAHQASHDAPGLGGGEGDDMPERGIKCAECGEFTSQSNTISHREGPFCFPCFKAKVFTEGGEESAP